MGFTFEFVEYRTLNARQQEAFNFQKISAVLADHGFVTMRLSSDWQGADFIAQHRDGAFLKVQLKSRLTFSTKYEKRDLYVCFPDADDWFICPHDELLRHVLEATKVGRSTSWRKGGYTYPRLSKAMRKRLEPYRLRARKALGVPRH